MQESTFRNKNPLLEQVTDDKMFTLKEQHSEVAVFSYVDEGPKITPRQIVGVEVEFRNDRIRECIAHVVLCTDGKRGLQLLHVEEMWMADMVDLETSTVHLPWIIPVRSAHFEIWVRLGRFFEEATGSLAAYIGRLGNLALQFLLPKVTVASMQSILAPTIEGSERMKTLMFRGMHGEMDAATCVGWPFGTIPLPGATFWETTLIHRSRDRAIDLRFSQASYVAVAALTSDGSIINAPLLVVFMRGGEIQLQVRNSRSRCIVPVPPGCTQVQVHAEESAIIMCCRMRPNKIIETDGHLNMQYAS